MGTAALAAILPLVATLVSHSAALIGRPGGASSRSPG